MPYTIAVFRGRGHTLVAVNHNWHSRDGSVPPIGLPASEAWPDVAWRHVQQRMDAVYLSGEPETLTIADGEITITPYPAAGPTQGVVTAHLPASQRPTTLPRLLDPVASGH
jgi:hypothetical protein